MMERTDFEQRINTLLLRPDPGTTAALFALGQELGQEDACDGARELLDSLRFISRHFSSETTQGVYEIIRHGAAALPSEMVAAAVYIEGGGTPQGAAEMADAGQFLYSHWLPSAEEISPLAVCDLTESGQRLSCHTLHFGAFDPDAALLSAQRYAHDRQLSVIDALLSLTADLKLDSGSGAGKLLVSGDPDMTGSLSAIFHRCPAMAARLTFDVDCGRTVVEYNPLWLELRQKQEPVQGGMQLTV